MSATMETTFSAAELTAALSNLTLSDNRSESSDCTNYEIADFNDRSPETRDARLATLILALDEDIPENVDDSIKELIQKHTSATAGAFIVSEHYLEYKQQMAAKKATEKELPRSKGRSPRQ